MESVYANFMKLVENKVKGNLEILTYVFKDGNNEIRKAIKIQDNIGNYITYILSQNSESLYAFISNLVDLSIKLPKGIKTIESIEPSYLLFSKLNNDDAEKLGLTNLFFDAMSLSYDIDNYTELTCINEITLPSSVKTIKQGAFRDLKYLKKIHISDSVETIEEKAFERSLISELVIPNSVKTLGNDAFASSNLVKIAIPESVQEIGEYCFANTKLTEVQLPNNFTAIPNGMFYGCRNLKNIKLPPLIKTIGNFAFSGTSLLNFKFSDNVTEVGASAFSGCSDCSFSSFPNSVEKVGRACFSNTKIDNFCWSEKIKEIPSHMFFLSELNNFVMSENVEDIGEGAFVGNNFRFFYIPKKVKKIRKNTFENCENLQYIEFRSEELEEVECNAFSNCGFSEFVVPKCIKKMNSSSISKCKNLENVVIESPNTKFEKEWLNDCKKLKFINYFGIPIYGNNMVFSYKNSLEFTKNLIEFIKTGNIDFNLNVYMYDYGEDFRLKKEKPNNGDDCNYIFTKLLKSIDVNDSNLIDLSNSIEKFNISIFDKNVSYFKNIGLSNDEIVQIIIDDNFNIFSATIDEAKKNYDYLIEQKIIDINILNRLIFDDCVSADFYESLKKYILIHRNIPDLFSSLLVENNELNKLELRDRLIYVSTLNSLDDNKSNSNYDKAKIMLKRNIFKTVIFNDKKRMASINDEF